MLGFVFVTDIDEVFLCFGDVAFGLHDHPMLANFGLRGLVCSANGFVHIDVNI